MVRLLAEQSDTISNVKLGGFRYQLQASYMSNYTEELLYNETVCLRMTIYMLPPLGLSTLANEFTAAARIIQSFSNELSILVSGKV